MSASQPDRVHYGTMNLSSKNVPPLTSGDAILKQLESLVVDKKSIDSLMVGPKEVMELCETVFPELVEENQIGKQDPKGWAENNTILIEEDKGQYGSDSFRGESLDVYVGGPAALCAAAIQGKSEEGSKVLYAHDDQRGWSNWKGSASYFHIRDVLPVYYWPDNHGLYCVYVTLKHAIERRLNKKGYIEQVKSDPAWNKLRLSYKGVFKDLTQLPLFVENQLRMFSDVGLHMKGTKLRAPENTTAYITTQHAHLTHSMMEHIQEPDMPILLKSNDLHKAIHLELGAEDAANISELTYKSLEEDVGEWVENHPVSSQQLEARGYDTNFVKEALDFPRDGYFPPYAGEALENIVSKGNGEVRSNLRLKKILYKKYFEDASTSRVVWEDTKSGETLTTNVNSLYLSLGPSANIHLVDPKENALRDMLSGPSADSPRLIDVLKKRTKAAGSSLLFMVKIDKSIVPPNKLVKFRDHIGSHNKHFVRLAEKEVFIDGAPFQFFLMQGVGGGHFPNGDAHAEAALNVFKANVIPLYGLEDSGVEYDIITARSCARIITAQNVFRVTTPLANMVGIYGLGGIGMTTMFPNGLLMKAVMKLRGQLARDEITNAEFEQRIRTSDFGSIPHWSAGNPFARNYARFIDSVKNPNLIGVRSKQSPIGKLAGSVHRIAVRLAR